MSPKITSVTRSRTAAFAVGALAAGALAMGSAYAVAQSDDATPTAKVSTTPTASVPQPSPSAPSASASTPAPTPTSTRGPNGAQINTWRKADGQQSIASSAADPAMTKAATDRVREVLAAATTITTPADPGSPHGSTNDKNAQAGRGGMPKLIGPQYASELSAERMDYAMSGWSRSGTPKLSKVNVNQTKSGYIVVGACVDSSAVRITTSSGDPVARVGNPITRHLYVLRPTARGLVVETHTTPERQTCTKG